MFGTTVSMKAVRKPSTRGLSIRQIRKSPPSTMASTASTSRRTGRT
jgi:hypothetical protein